MALVKIRHKATNTVKDAEEAVADQLIAGGEYEAHVEQKKPEVGSKKADKFEKDGTDAGKTGTGDGAGS